MGYITFSVGKLLMLNPRFQVIRAFNSSGFIIQSSSLSVAVSLLRTIQPPEARAITAARRAVQLWKF
jgi:hypothetical protein